MSLSSEHPIPIVDAPSHDITIHWTTFFVSFNYAKYSENAQNMLNMFIDHFEQLVMSKWYDYVILTFDVCEKSVSPFGRRPSERQTNETGACST